jgi:hypothetical protein
MDATQGESVTRRAGLPPSFRHMRREMGSRQRQPVLCKAANHLFAGLQTRSGRRGRRFKSGPPDQVKGHI